MLKKAQFIMFFYMWTPVNNPNYIVSCIKYDALVSTL